MHVEFTPNGVTYTHGDYDSDQDFSECTQEQFSRLHVDSKTDDIAKKLFCDEVLTESDTVNRPQPKPSRLSVSTRATDECVSTATSPIKKSKQKKPCRALEKGKEKVMDLDLRQNNRVDNLLLFSRSK